MYRIPLLPLAADIETKPILRLAARAHQAVGEVNGLAERIPKEAILINTLVLQEAKDSSAIENIVTTHDELYMAELDLANAALTAETKELMRSNMVFRGGAKTRSLEQSPHPRDTRKTDRQCPWLPSCAWYNSKKSVWRCRLHAPSNPRGGGGANEQP